MGKIFSPLLSLSIVGASCAWSPPARAALDDVLAAQAGEVRSLRVAGRLLSVHSHAGVDEYSEGGGKIFAIKWRRRFAPAVKTLLGPHLAEFEEAMRAHRRVSHGLLSLHTAKLAVQAHVRPRAAWGAMWLPQDLPKGVSIDALP